MQKYKQHRHLITVVCDQCGKEHLKPLSEYKRNKELGRHNFCSRSCACKYNSQHRSNKMIEYSNSKKNIEHLTLINKTRNLYVNKPEYRFTYMLRNCRKRFKECTLTLIDLQEQWEKQRGICPYSGVSLLIPTYKKNHKNPIYTASVDRIDSSKGYIPENIQFVSTCINYMKNTMSDEDTRFMCKCIAEYFYSEGTISSPCIAA